MSAVRVLRHTPVMAAVCLALAVGVAAREGQRPTPPAAAGTGATRWVATWAASPQVTEAANLPPPPGLADTTLRQIVHVSIGGTTLRVRFSNEFGKTALMLHAASVARAAGRGATAPGTLRPLTFAGRASVRIPEGASVVSDPLGFDLPAMADLAVTICVRGAPEEVTGHPGSRATSYLQTGDAVAAQDLPSGVPVDHWYFISGVEVLAGPSAAAVAILGDSITDGRGSTTNGNDRWPDVLSRRLRAVPATSQIAVLNLGIGGNRLLRDTIGPNALARFDRDVLARPGVRWLIVLEGINDIGTALGARAKGEPWASADDVIGAYRQIVDRAHAHDIRVFGATILPFEGFAAYFTADAESDRRNVNEWIRRSGRFDGVIDFDAIARDAAAPSRLAAAVDGGDHLHPSAAGYRIMGEAIDLALFTKGPVRR